MATIGGNVIKHIISEGNLFRSMMQRNVIENKFNCKDALLTIIYQSKVIKLTVQGVNKFYLNPNILRLHVIAMITTANITNIDVIKKMFNQPDAALIVTRECY